MHIHLSHNIQYTGIPVVPVVRRTYVRVLLYNNTVINNVLRITDYTITCGMCTYYYYSTWYIIPGTTINSTRTAVQQQQCILLPIFIFTDGHGWPWWYEPLPPPPTLSLHSLV